MNSKKSQISTQFAWIFILIAGAIILIFFITVIYKQKTVSETKISAEILSQLKIIFTGSGLTAGTLNIIQTPETEIDFVCNEETYSDYSISNTGLTEETPLQVIFAPDKIKGNEIMTWALSWDVPFKVTNFLYVTNSRVKYILVNPYNKIKEKIPAELPFEIVENQQDINSLDFEGVDKVKLVFFDGEMITIPSNLESKEDVSAVRITPEDIYFYKKDDDIFVEQSPVPYLQNNLPSIFGAIFSEDSTFYRCNMRKAFKRLSIVSKIYAGKETELKNYFNQHTCNVYYDDYIEEMFAPASDCSQDINPQDISKLDQKINKINREQDLLIENSCPLIY